MGGKEREGDGQREDGEGESETFQQTCSLHLSPACSLNAMQYATTEEGELALCDKCLDDRVYVPPGSAFFTAEHGWFRIVFCIPLDVLRLGG